MSDEQRQIEELRKAVETLTETVDKVRSANTHQTAEILAMVNLLMGRVDVLAQSSVLPDTDRGATRVGQDEQET